MSGKNQIQTMNTEEGRYGKFVTGLIFRPWMKELRRGRITLKFLKLLNDYEYNSFHLLIREEQVQIWLY